MNKDQNIGNYRYIGTWILHIYRKYRKNWKKSVDILKKNIDKTKNYSKFINFKNNKVNILKLFYKSNQYKIFIYFKI